MVEYNVEYLKKKFPTCDNSTIGLFAEIAETKMVYKKKSIKKENERIEVKILKGDYIIHFDT